MSPSLAKWKCPLFRNGGELGGWIAAGDARPNRAVARKAVFINLSRSAVHRTKHLNLADGIEAEPFGDPRLYELDDTTDGIFRVVGLYEVEVALSSGWAEIGDRALVDAMSTRNLLN